MDENIKKYYIILYQSNLFSSEFKSFLLKEEIKLLEIDEKDDFGSILEQYPAEIFLILTRKVFDQEILDKVGMLTSAFVYSEPLEDKEHYSELFSFLIDENNPGELREKIQEHCSMTLEMISEEEEMIDGFILESKPMLDEIEDLILMLEKESHNVDCLNTYFRLLHTIKGTAACVGLKALANYTHAYEDLINELKDGEKEITSDTISILLKGLDVVKEMFSNREKREHKKFDIENLVKIFKGQECLKEENNKDMKEALSPEVAKRISVPQIAENRVQTEVVKQEENLRIPIRSLDEFMELNGEMTVIRNMVMKTVKSLEQRIHGDKDLENLGEILAEMYEISSTLQYKMTELRKVSLSNIFRPLSRIVRDTSKALGKEISLKITGDDLRVDANIGTLLGNSLVHLIRNSCDHGVEEPEVRKSKNKPVLGEINLRALEVGDNIIIEIEDDGAGIDPEFIRKKVFEKGLFPLDELEKMNKRQIYNMIFQSGFSTAQKVTDLSGRGVGMDMVKSSIVNAGGKIEITSEINKGSCFHLQIPRPKSVLIIVALLIKIKNESMYLPQNEILEVIQLKVNDERIREIEGSHFIRYRDTLHPLVYLKNIIGHGENIDEENKLGEINIVILKEEGYEFGLVVDEIDDFEEIVVKKMSKFFKSLDLYSGCTFLGKGGVALVLSAEGMAKKLKIHKIQDDENFVGNENEEEINKRRYMLLDLHEIKKITIYLDDVYRLEDVETNRLEACGENIILHYRGKVMPLFFLDSKYNLKKYSDPEIVQNTFGEKLQVVVHQFERKFFGLVIEKVLDLSTTSRKIDKELMVNKYMKGSIYINDCLYTILDVKEIVKNHKNRKHRKHEKGKGKNNFLSFARNY